MIRPAILILTLCLTATPAAAHWDRTRWGMTPEAVKALYPSAVPSGDPALVDPSKPVLQLASPWVFDGQSFSLSRLFFRAGGRLDRVELVSSDTRGQVPGLLAWLERRYGKPVYTKGPLTAPAGGVEILEARYRGADGDRVVLNVLWAEGEALSAVSWEPPAG